jgi:hypothetical protein
VAAFFALVCTLIVSFLVTRIGSVALSLTGMAQDSARFQAKSAYTGVGFTTSESEQVVNNPVRRRILATLMTLGNVGIAVVIASMMGTFAAVGTNDNNLLLRVALLSCVLALLWVIGTRRWFDQGIERLIAYALRRWTHLDIHDYVSLLHLADGFVVFEICVNEGDWVCEKTLAESMLSAEGVLILGIHRANGKYIGSPNGDTNVHDGDVLTVYGPQLRLEELDLRQQGFQGDTAHRTAIEDQQKSTAEVDDNSENNDHLFSASD